MLEPGLVIDRYTVEDELGRGGMAVVYRVRHNTLGTLHALKVLSLNVPSIVERLIQEGRVQAQLQHPNVVAVTDVLDVYGSPGLLMELVRGPSLEDWLAGNRPPLDEALRLFDGILAALREAHRLDIVHRDLKPGNVMLSTQGGIWLPKVTDFGLAKLLADESAPTRTCTGLPMGTPAYMSPEQITDAKSVDRRTDIFALGCILYELTCGQMAFRGANTLEVFNAVAGGAYVPPRELAPSLPERVERAILGCLQQQREQRIPSCEALAAVLAGEPLHPSDAPTLAPPLPDELPPRRPPLAARPLGTPRPGSSAAPTFDPLDSLDDSLAPFASRDSGTRVPALPSEDPAAASPIPAATSHIPAATSQDSLLSTQDPAAPGRSHAWLWVALVLAAVAVVAALMVGGGLATWWFTRPEVVSEPTVQPEAVIDPIVARDTSASTPDVSPSPGATPVVTDPEPRPPTQALPPAVETPAATGVVRVDGDAVSVVLIDPRGGRHVPGRLPVGTYDLEAGFASGVTIRQPDQVTVRAGRTVTLRCVELLETCR